MNRHHPYGGAYESPVARRGGASPLGPGPDRTHRFTQERGGAPTRGRGFGRGRGGYGNFDGGSMSSGAYDQGPPQGDMGVYSNYDTPAPSQDFYQSNYNSGPPPQFPPAPPSTGFNQGFGNFEGALET